MKEEEKGTEEGREGGRQIVHRRQGGREGGTSDRQSGTNSSMIEGKEIMRKRASKATAAVKYA